MKNTAVPKDTVSAELWDVNMCEGVMDMIHGGGFVLREIYIPSAKIALNVWNNEVNCFSENGDRYSSETKTDQLMGKPAVFEGRILVPSEIVDAAILKVAAKQALDKHGSKIAEICGGKWRVGNEK